jgi:hypothetical protein
MPGYLLTTGSTIQCAHAAQVTGTTSNTRVKAAGQPVVLANDQFTVSGCPFQVPIGTGTKPQPCVCVQWLVPAARVFVQGTPVLLQVSQGLCLSAEQIPQGPPNVVQTQVNVQGT